MYENHTTTVSLDKSKLFSAFNLARWSGKFDRKRVNRALGIVQARKVALLPNGAALIEGNSEPAYWVDSHGCDCPDATFRNSVCKHQIARFIALKMQVLRGPEPTPEPPAAPAPPLSTREEREQAPLVRPASRKGELLSATLEADISALWG